MRLFQSPKPVPCAEEICSPAGLPCAQCGKAIERPEWSEPGEGRISFLWRCAACDYRFTTIAIFAASEAVAQTDASRLAA